MGAYALWALQWASYLSKVNAAVFKWTLDRVHLYWDDVIVFSQDFRTHLEHLGAVFQALERYGLKLQPEKCQLFLRHVKFLRHCVSGEGVTPDPDKLTVVREWPIP